MKLKRFVVPLLVVVLGVAGCTESESLPRSQTAPSASPSPTASEGASEPGGEASIYAAVIQELVLKDHTFGSGSSPFDHVYVVDGAVRGANDPMNGSLRRAPEPFSEELKEGILGQLKGLPPTEFVADPDDVRKGPDGMNGVKNNGVILVLGPIEEKAEQKVHVGNSIWCGGLCGQWLTYVLKQADGTWNIKGTTGPMAIS